MSSKIIPLQKTKPQNPLRSLQQFTREADMIARRHAELDELLDLVRKKIAAAPNTPAQLDRIFSEAVTTATLSSREQAMIERCAAALWVFDADEFYENDNCEGKLRRSAIGERVAVLLGAFPNGAPSDPAIYVRMMIEGISAIDELIMPALDAAILQIVTTQKFLPSVSEVLEVVNAQRVPWNERSWAIRDLADKSILVLGWIGKLRLAKHRR